jgi:hypothetical protein
MPMFGTGVRPSQAQPADAQALRILTLQPAAAGRAPFTMEIDSTLFNVTYDPILAIGYNLSADGNPILSSEPLFGWKVEGNYDDGSGQNKIESYFQYGDNDGNAYRPLFIQVNRVTDVSVMELVTNQVSYSIPNPANPVANRQVMILTDGTLTMAPQTAGNSLINVRAGASRKGILSLGYDGVDAVVQLQPGASNNFAQLTVNSQQFYFAANTSGIAAPGLGIGITAPISPLHIKATNLGLHVVTIDQITSGLGNLTQWRDSSAVILSRVGKGGRFMTSVNTAPADADVATGEAALWFDKTNGAGKLMVKAKTADGTVVTGSVTLA